MSSLILHNVPEEIDLCDSFISLQPYEEFVDLPDQFPFELLNQSEALMLREGIFVLHDPERAHSGPQMYAGFVMSVELLSN